MGKEHRYAITLNWEGNKGEGTGSYQKYDRTFSIEIAGKPRLIGSSDPGFRGDASLHNPEEMLVMSLSSCHMLWYLHLCAVNGIVVEEYCDTASGLMHENPDGSGEFVEVTLRPEVRISHGDKALALQLHEKANHLCFIARSMNFPVKHEPQIRNSPI